MDSKETYQIVREHYGEYAKLYDAEHNLEHSRKVAQAFGYTLDELASIPEGANLGVSCGNPLATANLTEVSRISLSSLAHGSPDVVDSLVLFEAREKWWWTWEAGQGSTFFSLRIKWDLMERRLDWI